MGKLGRRALVLLLAALSMSVIAACGGDDDDGGGGGGGGGGGEAKNGGSITISQTSQPIQDRRNIHGERHRAALAVYTRCSPTAHRDAVRTRSWFRSGGGHATISRTARRRVTLRKAQVSDGSPVKGRTSSTDSV